MSEIPNTVRYWPYRTRAVVCPSASLRPPNWASGGPSAEVIQTQAFAYAASLHNHQPTFRATQRGGAMTNQHPSLYSSARPRNTHHRTPVQSGAGQGLAYQGIRGSSGAQIPFLDYNTPMANMPDIPLADFHPAQNSHQRHQGMMGWLRVTQSLGACALQPNFQAAILTQPPPPKQDLPNLSTTTAQPEPSQPASVLSFEDAFSVNSSSVSEETVSKETVLQAWTCPFPGCNTNCRRPQELERHICGRHLPPYLHCGQPSCDLTWSRPDSRKIHHASIHPGVPMPEQAAFMIYNAKALARQVRTKKMGPKQAVDEASFLFEGKAIQMGKLDVWHWVNVL